MGKIILFNDIHREFMQAYDVKRRSDRLTRMGDEGKLGVVPSCDCRHGFYQWNDEDLASYRNALRDDFIAVNHELS